MGFEDIHSFHAKPDQTFPCASPPQSDTGTLAKIAILTDRYIIEESSYSPILEEPNRSGTFGPKNACPFRGMTKKNDMLR